VDGLRALSGARPGKDLLATMSSSREPNGDGFVGVAARERVVDLSDPRRPVLLRPDEHRREGAQGLELVPLIRRWIARIRCPERTAARPPAHGVGLCRWAPAVDVHHPTLQARQVRVLRADVAHDGAVVVVRRLLPGLSRLR
jgi:hypothetical protein